MSAINEINSMKEQQIGNDDWDLSVNDHRLLVRCKEREKKWTVLSSAVLKGGLQPYLDNLQVLNGKVPANYDGITPSPGDLLKKLAEGEEVLNTGNRKNGCAPTESHDQHRTTVGMLTAASMKTVGIATEWAGCVFRQQQPQQHNQVIVDAIVTAGISNSRSAGSDADCMSLSVATKDNGGQDPVKQPKFGTINTVVLINVSMTASALVESYSIAIEAKCRACNDLSIVCAKTGELAQGTGTDSTVITTPTAETETHSIGAIQFAGKHTIIGEMIGKAVYRATREALLTNLRRMYYGYPTLYRLHCHSLQLLRALQHGHQPLVPTQPMMPISGPSGWVLFVGLVGILSAFALHIRGHEEGGSEAFLFKPSVSVLIAFAFWDRFLGSFFQPVFIHPVVLVGKVIKTTLRCFPQSFFDKHNPVVGFSSGCLLFFLTLGISMAVSISLLLFFKTAVATRIFGKDSGSVLLPFLAWIVHVHLLKSSSSLHLLCNVALQMARFLERGQVQLGRKQLCWLCSRDPSTLQAEELAAGTLESLAENLSDSLVSPLFFYVLLGPLGAFGFKVVNTLDSCVGYRGDKFEYVGKFSARVDDFLNLFPSRLTALLLTIAATMILGSQRANHGLTTAWRDAKQCDSPNAGWPMATMAGLLNVRLEKKGEYSLNAKSKAPVYQDIRSGHFIALLAGGMAVLLALAATSLRLIFDI